jgi:hypothetical protein|nr:MAG TPA: hypothetical protein [Bacteriophage sp.]
MSKAKFKIKVQKGKKSGTKLAAIPVKVVKNDNPNGEKILAKGIQITVSPKINSHGQPRRKR